jgi:hypothetical protein
MEATVTISLDEYNKLVEENKKFKDSMSVEKPIYVSRYYPYQGWSETQIHSESDIIKELNNDIFVLTNKIDQLEDEILKNRATPRTLFSRIF